MRFGLLCPGKAFPFFRILEIEDEFRIELDMVALDTNRSQYWGLLSQYMAEIGKEIPLTG
jgi:hypothetical protein